MIDGHRQQFMSWVEARIPRGSSVAIMDVPVHRNAGDLFILAATERLLARLGCRIVHRTGVRDYRLRAAKQRIAADTILLGLGGGNFGDDYPRYQALRESVVRDFPAHRIVILPQTIHFSGGGALDRVAQVLSAHEDLHIAARDEASLNLARTFTPNVALLPDTVDVLGAALPQRNVTARATGDVVLMRRDRESASGPRPAHAIDWPDVYPGFMRRVALAATAMAVAPQPMSTRLHAWWSGYADDLLTRGRAWMAAQSHLVTDRLHAAILARLEGRPITLRDGGYGKLAAYYEQWWKDEPTIRLQPRLTE